MKLNANTAFLASLLVSVLLAGVFGYEANQYRQSLINTPEELAAQDAARAEQLPQSFHEENLILSRYVGASLGILAIALALVAWRVSRIIKGLGFRIVLAAISGALTWFYFIKFSSAGASFSPLPNWLSLYGLPGMFFAAGVLFPYLTQATCGWLRALGLIVAAAISFWAAVQVALELATWVIGPDFGILSYVSASLVGAAIVLTGARFTIPLHRTLALVLAGLVAAIVGGIAFKIAEPWPPSAFMIWHSLMAVVIYVAENRRLQIGKS